MRYLICWLVFAAFYVLPANAQSGEVTVHIGVSDEATASSRPPTGDLRWLIEGKGDFLLAEQHGATAQMTYQLPLGTYRITVWELETMATARGQVSLLPGTAPELFLDLRPSENGQVKAALERVNAPEENAADPTPSLAQDLADGLVAEGFVTGTLDGAPVTFTSVYWQAFDRHSLTVGTILGKPQFSIMASTIAPDGTAGRLVLVISIDPSESDGSSSFRIGEVRITDAEGRNRPLRAESPPRLSNFMVSANGRIRFDIHADLYRFERSDGRGWKRADDAAPVVLSGAYAGTIDADVSPIN